MFKYGFTEFGKEVKKRLIDLDTSQYQKYSTFKGQRKELCK